MVSMVARVERRGPQAEMTCISMTGGYLYTLASAVMNAVSAVFTAIARLFSALFNAIYNCLCCPRQVEVIAPSVQLAAAPDEEALEVAPEPVLPNPLLLAGNELRALAQAGGRTEDQIVEVVLGAFDTLIRREFLTVGDAIQGFRTLWLVGNVPRAEQRAVAERVTTTLVVRQRLSRADQELMMSRLFPVAAPLEPVAQRPVVSDERRIRVGVSRVTQAAIDAARGLTITQRGMRTVPPLPGNEVLPPDFDQIDFSELLTLYTRLAARPGALGLNRTHVESEIQFAQIENGPDYTTSYRMAVRHFILQARRSDISDDAKWAALISICSWAVDGVGCLPRRLEDVWAQVDALRDGGQGLRRSIIAWNKTEKEDALRKSLVANGVDNHRVMHHMNYARREVGLEWGLSRDPAYIQDSYIPRYGSSRTPDQIKGYLRESYTPAVMIQVMCDRLSGYELRRLFTAEMSEIGRAGRLPDDWEADFYLADGLTPAPKGVAFALQDMGFLAARA